MEVNGTAVISIPLFIKSKFGGEKFDLWLKSLSPEAYDVYKTSIFPSLWYPLKEILIEPTKRICDQFYEGRLDGAWESGRYSADYGLKGIYKMFVKLSSPEFLIKKASVILPTYYRPSTMKVVENRRGFAIVHVTEFADIEKVIEYRMGGWMERALEICGCKKVKMEITKSITKKDPYTEFQATWE
jgi:hypothetical protein